MTRAAWRRVAGGVEVCVRATPKAARDAIEGVVADAAGRRFLQVRVRTAPEKGKANAAIEALLAMALDLPASAVSVEKGETARIKTVRILGDGSIAAKLEALTGEADAG